MVVLLLLVVFYGSSPSHSLSLKCITQVLLILLLAIPILAGEPEESDAIKQFKLLSTKDQDELLRIHTAKQVIRLYTYYNLSKR